MAVQEPMFVFCTPDPNTGVNIAGEFDLTPYIMELNPSHEDIDAEGSGRDVEGTGDDPARMQRRYLNEKHTYVVKLWPVGQDVISQMYYYMHRGYAREYDPDHPYNKYPYYNARVRLPCTGSVPYPAPEFYTSSINYGSQVFDKNTGKCKYYGVTFSAIQR